MAPRPVLAALLAGSVVILLLVWRARWMRRLDGLEAQVRALTRRVYLLETRGAEVPPPQPAPGTGVPGPAATPRRRSIPRWRERLAGPEWEAVAGASWLNKLGVLVLVIGLSLFLRLSLEHLGAAGKIGVGAAASLALLAGGLALEARPRYRVFARGLIGGGWAALYFTAYAMHGIPAARVIRDPAAGMAPVSLVAAAMIVHALRYRSQTAAGMAYLAGFAALALSPVTAFSLAASMPLAISLLAVSWRSGWSALPVAGLALTYGVYGLENRPEIAGRFLGGQTVLWVYWLMFEAFDVLEQRRSRGRRGLARALFPLNAAAFAGLHVLLWTPRGEVPLALFFFSASAAYFASALVRARFTPPAAGGPVPIAERLTAGYLGAAAAAAALGAAAVFRQFSGWQINLGLLIEAQLLALAGIRLRDRGLRALGDAVLALAAGKLLFFDLTQTGTVIALGRQWAHWTPAALWTAGVLVLNRALAGRGWGYTWLAGLLAALVTGHELRREFVAAAWLGLAVAAIELGRRRGREFLWCGFALGAAGLTAALVYNAVDTAHAGPAALKAGTLLAAAACFVAALRLAGLARAVSSSAGSLLLAVLLWHALPGAAIAAAWAALAAALAAAGSRTGHRPFAVQALLLGAAAFVRAWAHDFGLDGSIGAVPRRVASGSLVAALCFAAQFLARDHRARAFHALLGAATLAVLAGYQISGRMLTVAWGAEAALLLAGGFAARERVLRLSGLFLFLLCLGKLFGYDLRELDAFSRIVSFLVLGVLLVAASWVYSRLRK